jgi:hypothetical protein
VISDIFGRDMLEALIAGQRDPCVLARMKVMPPSLAVMPAVSPDAARLCLRHLSGCTGGLRSPRGVGHDLGG